MYSKLFKKPVCSSLMSVESERERLQRRHERAHWKAKMSSRNLKSFQSRDMLDALSAIYSDLIETHVAPALLRQVEKTNCVEIERRHVEALFYERTPIKNMDSLQRLIASRLSMQQRLLLIGMQHQVQQRDGEQGDDRAKKRQRT
jgi:hypothetical protein